MAEMPFEGNQRESKGRTDVKNGVQKWVAVGLGTVALAFSSSSLVTRQRSYSLAGLRIPLVPARCTPPRLTVPADCSQMLRFAGS